MFHELEDGLNWMVLRDLVGVFYLSINRNDYQGNGETAATVLYCPCDQIISGVPPSGHRKFHLL